MMTVQADEIVYQDEAYSPGIREARMSADTN